MRAVFVNYIHPDYPHVSSMRLRYFAEALAKRGHQIILLTSTLKKTDNAKPPEQVEAELEKHDWSHYYHLTCPSIKLRSLDVLRNGKLFVPLRKAIIAWHYIVNGGIYCDWTKGSFPYWNLITRKFEPNITFGVFGCTDTLLIAKGIAELGKIPWILDVKDSWVDFIPKLIRNNMAKRFKDASAMTINSMFLEKKIKRWFPQNSSIIYSGVSPSAIRTSEKDTNNNFQIMLVGSVYNPRTLKNFIDAIWKWIEKLTEKEQKKILFTYAGTDIEMVSKATSKLKSICKLDLHPYLKLKDYFQLCNKSSVNCIISMESTFHHKLIELLYLRKPVIIYPYIDEEEKFLAEKTKTKLLHCSDFEGLTRSFQDLWLSRNNVESHGDPYELVKFTWEAQAEKLETLLNHNIKIQPH